MSALHHPYCKTITILNILDITNRNKVGLPEISICCLMPYFTYGINDNKKLL